MWKEINKKKNIKIKLTDNIDEICEQTLREDTYRSVT